MRYGLREARPRSRTTLRTGEVERRRLPLQSPKRFESYRDGAGVDSRGSKIRLCDGRNADVTFLRVPCDKRKRELDGADDFTFEEFGVGSDTEGIQQARLYLP